MEYEKKISNKKFVLIFSYFNLKTITLYCLETEHKIINKYNE